MYMCLFHHCGLVHVISEFMHKSQHILNQVYIQVYSGKILHIKDVGHFDLKVIVATSRLLI